MKQYIGTKVLNATPMSRGKYNSYRGWALPEEEDMADEGYLVEYLDDGKANDSRHKGYISWSPKEQFDKTYRENAGELSFGQAIEALELGHRVARKGWNGRGMWLVLVPGTSSVTFTAGSAYHKAGLVCGDILPHIDMYTTNAGGRRAMLPGWLASQSDMLSKDWFIV